MNHEKRKLKLEKRIAQLKQKKKKHVLRNAKQEIVNKIWFVIKIDDEYSFRSDESFRQFLKQWAQKREKLIISACQDAKAYQKKKALPADRCAYQGAKDEEWLIKLWNIKWNRSENFIFVSMEITKKKNHQNKTKTKVIKMRYI